MIDDNIEEAIAALEAALDPDALATAVLDQTGQDLVAYDEASAPYQDRTGRLRDGYDYEVGQEGQDAHYVEEWNEVEYAEHVEAKEGYSVLTAFDSGQAERILQQAFDQHKLTGEI